MQVNVKIPGSRPGAFPLVITVTRENGSVAVAKVR